MNKKKLLVFDMDGTILNTLEDLFDSTNYALRFHGLPERTIDEVRRFVGNGIHKLIERAVPWETSGEIIDKVFDTFLRYYQLHCYDKTMPYPGIRKLLEEAKNRGIKIAIVSNKADAAVQELAERFFDGLSDFSVGEHAGVEKKPAADMVYAALDKLGVSKEDAVYIGDSDVDVDTAANSGLDHIIVTWGFRDVDFLKEHGARIFAERPEEILDICC